MAYVKSHCAKFVFFLFCLSQVQGATRLLSEKPDNPYDELIKEIILSADKISERLQHRLSETGLSIGKFEDAYGDYKRVYVEKFKAVVHGVFDFPINDFFDRIVEELKNKYPEIGEKIKKLDADVNELNEETSKAFLERFNEIKEEVVTKTKPLAKRLIRIVKDIEEIILTLIPDKKKEFKKN